MTKMSSNNKIGMQSLGEQQGIRGYIVFAAIITSIDQGAERPHVAPTALLAGRTAVCC